MNYSEPPRTASGAPRAIAWVLVALGSASFLFLAFLQARIFPASVLGSSLFFLAFGFLEAGAIWAAFKRHFGVSIALGGFVGLSLGSVSLGVLVVGFGGL